MQNLVANLKVLFLSYDGLTDQLGQSQILPYIIGLTERGNRFSIISFEKPELYAKHGRAMHKYCEDAQISWHPLMYNKRPPILSTIRDMRKMYRLAKKLHGDIGFDLVHARSYPPAIVAAELKKAKGLPFVFDMRGFYADERVDGKIWNLNNPIYRYIYAYFKRKERLLIREASSIVILTHAGKTEVSSWLDAELKRVQNPDYYTSDLEDHYAEKIVVIPCMVDTNHFDPNQIKLSRQKWIGAVHGIDTEYEYLGYVGSIGTWYLTKEMVDCYNVIRKAHPKVRFLLVSKDDTHELKAYSRSLGIPESHFIHVSANRREVPVLISLMKAAIFFIMPAYSKKASSPTKQAELMAMGLPIICNDGVGDTGQIVRDWKAGMVLETCTNQWYVRAAEQWSQITGLAGPEIRQAAIQALSLEQGLAGFQAVYRIALK